ncbi:pyridoxal phosphate-dependent decarboxylase family protein [Haloferacaceae archaeon DSL9]
MNRPALAGETDLDDPTPERWFLGTDAGDATYRTAVAAARDAVLAASGDGPYAGRTYQSLSDAVDSVDPLPEAGAGFDAALEWLADVVLSNAVDVSDPRCVAHLQCPPLITGLAAELLLTAFNQSLDSWDQSPSATPVEESLIDGLAELFGLDAAADGVFTAGGTESNLLGLLLARDRYLDEAFDRRVREDGLPPTAADLRILCSEAGHFTANQAAAVLGLGERAVVTVPTDDARRMDPAALDETLDRLDRDRKRPFAVVATAGTTDFGSIDPLGAIADRAADRDLWLHVDAAYGGALAFCPDRRELLAGIDRADSIGIDFHKLCYQPISCGACLLADGSDYGSIARNAAYLNPEVDESAGVPNLVSKSLATTRRFDALKPFLTFRALGTRGLASLVGRTLTLAADAATLLDDDPSFELAVEPTLNAVVFRYRPSESHPTLDGAAWADRVNREIRDRLLASGQAVVARTEVDDRVHLKLTLLNPKTTLDDVADILADVERHGAAIESEVGA